MTVRKCFILLFMILFENMIFAETININSNWEMIPDGMSSVQSDMPCFYVWEDYSCDFLENFTQDPDRYRIFRDHPEVTYRKTLNTPALDSNERLFVRFDAVNYLCEISVNGTLIGDHLGGYAPFEMDITDALSGTGTDILEVDVIYDDSRLLDKRDWGTYPQLGVGYAGWNWHLGIIGNVDLVVRPYVFIEDIYVQTSVQNRQIGVDVSVVNASQSSIQVSIQTKIMYESTDVFSMSSRIIQVAANQASTFHLSNSWQNPTLWTPDNPHLYKVQSTLSASPNISHLKTQIFGFREFKINGTYFTLNGVRTNLRGDNIVVDTELSLIPYLEPDSLNWIASIDSMLALNFNIIRFHQAPPPDWMLRICDQKGMMVANESIVYDEHVVNSQQYVDNTINWIPSWIKRDRNHPSVVLWCAVNEKVIPSLVLTWDQLVSIGAAIEALDATRPILYEGDLDLNGNGDIYSIHYPYGWLVHRYPSGGIYDISQHVHETKPSSWGEFEWSRGSTEERITRDEWVLLHGIKTRAARILEVADIRPYRLDWAWHPNANFSQGMYDFTATREQAQFIANSCNPVAVFDRSYYENEMDPVLPQFNENEYGSRNYVFFNDEMTRTLIKVKWETIYDGAIFASDSFNITVPLGEYIEQSFSFKVPIVPYTTAFFLKISTYKNGQKKFEDSIKYRSVDTGIALPGIPDNISLQPANGDLTLNWDDVTENQEGNGVTIDHYEVIRSTSPDFPQGSTTTISPIQPSNYTDTMNGVVGDTLVQYFYKIKVVDEDGLTSESDVYGEFDLLLVTTENTDFNLVSIPLNVNDSYDTASEYLNFFPNCNSIAKWDADEQGYVQYPSLVNNINFDLDPGMPCFVNTTEDSLFTFFGEPVTPNYDLVDASPTAWNIIMLPFEKDHLTDAADLYGDIPNCDGVALWNNRQQAFEMQYSPASPQNNFDIYAGHPYWVHVTANGSWPTGSPASKTIPKPVNPIERRRVPHLVQGQFNHELMHVTHYQARLNHLEYYLNESSAGCGMNSEQWWIQCGNFKSGWQGGDTLLVRYFDGFSNYLGETFHILTHNPVDKVMASETSIYSIHSSKNQYKLLKNYPNPFNPSTSIEYFVESDGLVDIAIYNIQGQKVRALRNRKHDSGLYTVEWDARNDKGVLVESGVYFIHLYSEIQNQYKKVIFMK